MNRALPPFLKELIDNPPAAGDGVHDWLFTCARNLHAHLPESEIFNLLSARVSACGRHVSGREIRDAIRNSKSCAFQFRNGKPIEGATGSSIVAPPGQQAEPIWPTPNREQIEAIVAESKFGTYELWESSPVRVDGPNATESIVDVLFPGNPLVCVSNSVKRAETAPRESFRGTLSDKSFIVPSPMTAETGLTSAGKLSARSNNNVGPRRFLVIEFDQGGTDEHAALLMNLAYWLPLALVVHSGGKSLHGWFYCQGFPGDKLRIFMRMAVTIGADRATWTRCQFVRMPDGRRDNGQRQSVFYFSPEVTK